MGDFDELADGLPDLRGDPCLTNGRRRNLIKLAKAANAQMWEKFRADSVSGNRLRMSAHTPSLPKLKFMGDE